MQGRSLLRLLLGLGILNPISALDFDASRLRRCGRSIWCSFHACRRQDLTESAPAPAWSGNRAPNSTGSWAPQPATPRQMTRSRARRQSATGRDHMAERVGSTPRKCRSGPGAHGQGAAV